MAHRDYSMIIKAITGCTEANPEKINNQDCLDSFIETLGSWAKTVVVGRAKLGGIPCGVVP